MFFGLAKSDLCEDELQTLQSLVSRTRGNGIDFQVNRNGSACKRPQLSVFA